MGKQKILFVAHCILNISSKVVMWDYDDMAAEEDLRQKFLMKAIPQGIQLVQLPCPEFTLYGPRRWGHVSDQFDNVFFRNHCRKLLEPILDQCEEYLATPERYEVLGFAGIDGSPSCGVDYTGSSREYYGSLGGHPDPMSVYATGELVTDPWVVNVDGVPVAVVDSKAAGESVETGLRMHYAGSDFEAQQEIEMVNEITVTKYDFEDANTHPVVMNGADAVSYIIGLNETRESPVVGFKTTRYTSAEEEIPFDTVEMEDDGFALGETQVTQEGENGAMETTYFETLLNGKVISSVAVDQTVTKEPVDKVVVTGTKEPEPEPEPEEEPAQTSSSSGSGSS